MKRYPAYKDSGVRWIGEVPDQWNTLKIKWLSPVKRGASPRPIDDPKYFDDDGEFSWVRIADVTASERYLEHTTQTLSELGSSLSVKRYPGDFFVSIAGTVGKPIITKIKCCIHDGFVYFPLLRINPEFLYYMFSAGELFNGLGKWGTQLNLNTETVGDINVPLPSDSETEKILKHLDQKTHLIDTLIEKKQKQIELLQEQRAAIINQAVTKGLNPNVKLKDSGIEWLGEVPEHWNFCRVKNLMEMNGGYAFSSNDFIETGVQLIKIGNLYQNELHLERQPTYLPEQFLNQYPDFIVSKGDILMSLTGTLGKRDYGFAVMLKTDDKFLLNQRVGKLRVKSNHDVAFGFYLLRSESYLNKLYSQPAGTKQGNLSNENVINIRVAVPTDRIEQGQIALFITEKIRQLNTAAEKIRESINLLSEYRTTLISEVVTGKIDVRDEGIP